jgi:hypothetical protein
MQGDEGKGEKYTVRSFLLCTPHQIDGSYRIGEEEIGRSCSTHVHRKFRKPYRKWAARNIWQDNIKISLN